jgi:voltage-gated potassium channel Kch
LQFPEPDGPLTGFAARVAGSCGVGGETVAAAERVLGARILAVDSKTDLARDTVLAGRAELIVYGDVAGLQGSTPRRPATRHHPVLGRRLRSLLHPGRRPPPRLNPILVRLAVAALTVLLLGTWYFHAAFKGAWLDAVYFVVATMTTTGYGDLTPDRSHPVEIVAAMLLMLAGTIITGLFIAFGASLLTRVHWVRMQGLRPVHRRGHIVVCGAGSIGSEVIDLLLALGKHLVVVEVSPDTAMVEKAREQRFDLLTGDASRDATLDLCNLDAAHGLIALTNVDTLNLEIALGARARNPTMPIVLRIAEASFAHSIARHFEFETTYSAAALAAPAFVGLSRFPGSRGRVAFAGQEFAVGEVGIAEDGAPPGPRDAILLAVSRRGDFAIADDFAELGPGDRALVIVPLASFREGKDTLAAAAARYLPGG